MSNSLGRSAPWYSRDVSNRYLERKRGGEYIGQFLHYPRQSVHTRPTRSEPLQPLRKWQRVSYYTIYAHE